MTIKAYFDCEWTGPKIEVDSKGNVTSADKSAVGACYRSFQFVLSSCHFT